MKIHEFLKILNKNRKVELSRMLEIKKKYLSLSRAYMFKMYDKGYISDPTDFNRREIIGNICDYGLTGMYDSAGVVQLTYKQCMFAKIKNQNIKSAKEFLILMGNALKYKEFCQEIDRFFDLLTFKKNSESISLGLILSGSEIFSRKGYHLCIPVLECLTPFNDRVQVKKHTFKEEIFSLALEELGIEDEIQDGMFIQGFTHQQEVLFSDMIFNGLVKTNGTYSKILQDWLKSHKWSTNEIDSVHLFMRDGLYTYIISQKNEEMHNIQSKWLHYFFSQKEEGKICDVMCVNSDEIFFTKKADKYLFTVSPFAFICGEEDEIACSRNALEGYIGDAYSIEYLRSIDKHYVGCPFELYSNNKTKELFVDVEQTDIQNYQKENNFKYMNAEFVCSDSLYKEGVFEKGSLEDRIFKAFGEAETGKIIHSLPFDFSREELEEAKKSVYTKVIKNLG